ASFTDDLRSAIVAFAKADARAHHPTPLADQIAQQKAATSTSTSAQTGTQTASTSTGTGTQKSAAPGTGNPSAAPKKKSSGGSSIGLIILLAALGVLALVGGGAWARKASGAARFRRDKRAEALAKAQADLTKLGEGIRDLDLDTEMPNADPAGKAAYAKALDCYQGGERRLKNNTDDYGFQRAVEVIAAGLKHLDEAQRCFDQAGRAKQLLPAQAVERLTKLAKLHSSGALTDAEFAAEKKKVLD